MLDLKRVREFEKKLDSWLESLPTVHRYRWDTLVSLGNIIDTAGAWEHGSRLSWMVHGLDVLLPHFARPTSGPDADYEILTEDLWKASQYFSLRELLYYTYNVPSAIAWDFDRNDITIRYADRTLPRQFYLTANNHYFYSREISELMDGSSTQIRELLSESPEFRVTDNHLRAWPLLEREADEKLRRYYSLLDPASSLDMGGYTYGQFHAVFRSFLIKALYHRYLARIRGGGGAVTMNKHRLAESVAGDLGLSPVVASRIISDMTYSEQDRSRRLNPVYFSLYELPQSDTVMMIPAAFAVAEGLIRVIRRVGLRSPRLFNSQLSTPLADAMVSRVREEFEAQGFQCRSNVGLGKFDSSLPDIDLLVISEELTLGYHLFLLEVKNPLPPLWAKDQIRVLEPYSIAKAFTQLERIVAFLRTDDGVAVIRSLLPCEGLPHFGTEFVVVIRSMVVTSNNAGMFFGNADRSIIDYRTLARIVRASDGDVTYINHALAHLSKWVDDIMVTTFAEVDIDGVRVRYEGVTHGPIFDLKQAEYRSVGLDQEIARNFRESGGHPFDVLRATADDSDQSNDMSHAEELMDR